MYGRRRGGGIVLASLGAAEMRRVRGSRAGGLNKGVASAYAGLAVARVACRGWLMAVASLTIRPAPF